MAFTAYDSETEWILTKDYGEIYFNSYTWGYDENGVPFTERLRLNDHSCSKEELGMEGKVKNHRFFPSHSASSGLLSLYQKKLICPEIDNLFIYGDFNTAKAR